MADSSQQLHNEIIRRLDRLENKLDVFRDITHRNEADILNIKKNEETNVKSGEMKSVKGSITILYSLIITIIGAAVGAWVSTL